jgi:hypothetical protein
VWGAQRDHAAECLEARGPLLERAGRFLERGKETMIRYGEALDSWDDPEFDFQEAVRECHHQFQLYCDDASQFFADRAMLPVVEFSYEHVEDRDYKVHAHALECIRCFCDVRGKGFVWVNERNCYLCLDCERKQKLEGGERGDM